MMMKECCSVGGLNIDLSISLQHQRQPVQLDLMPCAPAASKNNAWPFQRSAAEANSGSRGAGIIDVNQVPSSQEVDEADQIPISSSSPNNSGSFQLGTNGSSSKLLKRERDSSGNNNNEDRCEITSSRASDEEEGATRKKLRLTKEQSALLEDSFREHSTLNPKQKNALARQLNLRPRQVEVWFQNRRARTKLKQTEVDCELLKRCCEGLTEENRRLQKELQELRALKVSPPCLITHDFYMPLPATSLTMCPSCERLASAAAVVDHNAVIASRRGQQQQHQLAVTSPNSKQGLVKYLTT